MPDDAEFSKSGWRFVALFRFEQTNKDGKKVFFNFQAVPSSTSKEILSIFRQHSDLTEFYDEPEPNKPANDGVLDLTAEGKLFSGKVHALKVKLDQVKDSREYFTILEGPLAGHKASVKLADDGKSYLSPEILHAPASFLTYSKKNQTLTLDINGVKTDYLIIMSNEDPIPNGKYDLEIPYEPHHLYGEPYENFSLYAKTWFRIGHTGDRYLHLGKVSKGCITVRAGDNKPGAWDEIYRRLIVSRMGDSMNVGTVSVVD